MTDYLKFDQTKLTIVDIIEIHNKEYELRQIKKRNKVKKHRHSKQRKNK